MSEGPDRGRSWFIVLVNLFINIIQAGIIRGQGILFVAFINVYKLHRKEAALPFSIFIAMRNMFGPVAGILGQKYNAPVVIAAGGFLAAVGSILCFFATNIIWFTIFWGGITGMGMGLVTVLPPIVLMQYFSKYRTTAAGLAFSGICMGSLIMPAVLEVLLQYYGIEGTFLIMAAIIMQTIPAGIFYKQPPWLKNGVKDRTAEKGKISNQEMNSGVTEPKDFSNFSNGINEELLNKYHNQQKEETNNEILVLSKQSTCSLNTDQSFNHHIHLNDLYHAHTTANIASARPNTPIKYGCNMSIDLHYLNRMSDLIFQMFCTKIPYTEVPCPAVSLKEEQDKIWHPEKREIMQEIVNMYLYTENTFQTSDAIMKGNNLHTTHTLLNEKLSINIKTEIIHSDKKNFENDQERCLQSGKIHSVPNISLICNELAIKEYVISKMRQLCNINEIRIITVLSQYNERDILGVLFYIRNLYKLYNDLKYTEKCASSQSYKNLFNAKDESTDKQKDCMQVKSKITVEESQSIILPRTVTNSFSHHIKAALKLHTNPLYLLICSSRTVFILTFPPVFTFIVDFAMDNGLQEQDGKFVIGILSLGELAACLCLGWITDRGFITLPRYMLAGMIIQGFSAMSLPLMQTRWTLFPSIFFFSMTHGSVVLRQTVLIAKYLEIHEQSIAGGCINFFGGIISLILPLYIGFFRDEIGSYNPMFYINGSISILAGTAWLFEPYIIKNREKRASNYH